MTDKVRTLNDCRMTAPVGSALRRAFANYRAHMEVARDPDEGASVRRRAWDRAANARRKLEREIGRVEAAGL